MEFNLWQSMVRPFKANKFVEKFLIGGGFYLIAAVIHFVNVFVYAMGAQNLAGANIQESFVNGLKLGMAFSYSTPQGLLGSLIISLICAIPLGYLICYIHNYLHSKEDALPDWTGNIFSYFKKGMSAYVLLIFYFVLCLICVCVIAVSWGVFSAITQVVTREVAKIIGGCIGQVVLFLSYLLIPFILSLYAENFKLSNGFKVFTVFKYAFSNFGKFALCSLVCGVVAIVYGLVDMVLRVTVIAIPFLSFLILPVTLCLITPFVSLYIIAKGKSNIVEESKDIDAFDLAREINSSN